MMNNKKKIMLGGSVLATAIIGIGQVQANNNVISFNPLGSGAEIRANLLNNNSAVSALELTCGKAEKTAEHKCGEGKCGEKKECTEPKTEGAAAKKCCEKEGEKKCSEKKEASESTKEGKAAEHKCGEGKCGK